jgi:hypothetical protein
MRFGGERGRSGTLKSTNREKVLVEGARKEGKVNFYTGLIVDQVVRPVKDAFEKEYPFLQVEFFRGNSERVAQRVLTEYQAKRYEVDVVSSSAATTMVQRAGYMQRFFSPHFAEYPSELKDAKGFWGSTNVYFMTLGYNTRSVKPGELPKTYDDLLNPRWKGQMMWSTSRGSGAPQFIGNIFVTMGQEAGKAYMQKLKQQNIAKSTASARQILDLGDRRRISLSPSRSSIITPISASPPARRSIGSRSSQVPPRTTPSAWRKTRPIRMPQCSFWILYYPKKGQQVFPKSKLSSRASRCACAASGSQARWWPFQES